MTRIAGALAFERSAGTALVLPIDTARDGWLQLVA